MAEPLIGPVPVVGPGDDPSVVGGNAQMAEYKPFDENARMAIFGYNPATGKAFTDAESRAANAGYNPLDVSGGAVGYRIDPKTKQLQVLLGDGTVGGYGQYTQTSKGGIVPNLPSNWGAFQYDDYGRPINAQGKPITDEDIRKYNELVGSNPAAAKEFATGKGIAVADGQLLTGSGLKQGSGSSAFTNQSGAPNNPYEPGTPQYEDFKERRSAYDLLFSEFKTYGLDSLVTPLKDLIMEGVSPAEFTIRLRETDAYKKRFAANAQRVAKGLRALSEAEYIGTEDQYQDVMRRYGMPESYYTKGDLGIQSGFEKFLAGDVSAVELEDRIQTAQNRVVNSNPEVARALKEFYPGISNGDILAYVLDPSNAIEQIKRKVTAAEIGGAAIQSGLQTGMTRAEELAAAGITKQQAQQGFQTVAEVAPRGGQLAEIYKQSPYTQTTAEQEVFGLAGSVDAAKQRKKLTSLETAAFSGSAGSGAIARERAGSF